VSARPHYTPYHPKWHRRRVSVWWWLKSGSYAFFVLRELTSIFVALAAFLLLGLVVSVARGPGAWAAFLAALGHPVAVAASAVALALVLFHAVTWFHLAPKAMAFDVAGRPVPDRLVVALNYVAWLVASGAVAALLLGG
jgi:fumarate reductase subunit C